MVVQARRRLRPLSLQRLKPGHSSKGCSFICADDEESKRSVIALKDKRVSVSSLGSAYYRAIETHCFTRPMRDHHPFPSAFRPKHNLVRASLKGRNHKALLMNRNRPCTVFVRESASGTPHFAMFDNDRVRGKPLSRKECAIFVSLQFFLPTHCRQPSYYSDWPLVPYSAVAMPRCHQAALCPVRPSCPPSVTLPPTFIQRERDSEFECCPFGRVGQRGLSRSFAGCAA